MSLSDEQFFAEHRDRHYRIRVPEMLEGETEFLSLGPHRLDRRRMIVMKADNSEARRQGLRVLAIPFLLYADETVEDRDDILKPIVNEIMVDAAQKYGMAR